MYKLHKIRRISINLMKTNWRKSNKNMIPNQKTFSKKPGMPLTLVKTKKWLKTVQRTIKLENNNSRQ